jgi:hypothetical protein
VCEWKVSFSGKSTVIEWNDSRIYRTVYEKRVNEVVLGINKIYFKEDVMANPVAGTCVRFIRTSDNVEFNALVLSDEGPGFVGIVYVDTTVIPANILTASPVPVAVPNAFGLVIE